VRFEVGETGETFVLVLSERNLLALLAKLRNPQSLRTLTSDNGYRGGVPIDDMTVVVHAEPDELHYAGRIEPPGAMDESIEQFLTIHTAVTRPPANTDSAAPNWVPFVLSPWLLGQHQIWVDGHGVEHEIETMPLDGTEQALTYCTRQMMRLCTAAARAGNDKQAAEITRRCERVFREEMHNAAARSQQRLAGTENEITEWLNQLPLLRALNRRQQRLTNHREPRSRTGDPN
jgi:hypothetical protein